MRVHATWRASLGAAGERWHRSIKVLWTALTPLFLWLQGSNQTKLIQSRKTGLVSVHASGKWFWDFFPLLSSSRLLICNMKSSFSWGLILPSQFFFYLEELLPCLLGSFILQDNTAVCLISQAAFLLCNSQGSNESYQSCYLSRSLTFTLGFRFQQ